MNITPECLHCLYGQALKSARLIGCSEAQTKEILDATAQTLIRLQPGSVPPPVAAVPIYDAIAQIVGQSDPIKPYKQMATVQAAKTLAHVRMQIAASKHPILTALRAAIAGNVLDFGAQKHFDLAAELDRVFAAPLAVDDSGRLLESLETAKTVLVLGDNAGEHLFDNLLLETLAAAYSAQRRIYATRGKPAINDITLDEAKADGLDRFAELISSGVDTPGTVLDRTDAVFRKHFETADVVIAKGMGNYECLEGCGKAELYFLFKIKCSVVAAATHQAEGSLMILRNSASKDSSRLES